MNTMIPITRPWDFNLDVGTIYGAGMVTSNTVTQNMALYAVLDNE
jgi:hypothetical protein